jgi:prepilin signal peptidase PulO-like enzyme (type II secretory pathway)
MDRTQFNGNSEMVQTGVEARPIERKHTPYKISKKITVMLITFISTWANYGLVSNLNMPSSSKIILALALMLLTSFSILWALVDIDTMYLDMPTFYLGLSVTWILVAAGALSSGKFTHFLPGLTMTILMVFIFEVINLIYKRLRGSDGMGMGDTMIILGTIGVPTAISGAWQMGYRITMLSFLLGIVGWLYNKVKNNATKEEPFAFGPYLAVGWMLAVVTWQLTNGVLPTGF